MRLLELPTVPNGLELLAIAPGYHEQVRDLTSSTALMVARRLASRARRTDRVRSTLACAAISRLRSLSGEIDALERELTAALDREAPANLLAICGVGPIVAAKILGEVRDVGRFSSAAAFASYSGTAPIPASSGRTIRHRLHRGGNRQLNRALHTVALTQARRDDRAKLFLARKRAEGKTPREATSLTSRGGSSPFMTPTGWLPFIPTRQLPRRQTWPARFASWRSFDTRVSCRLGSSTLRSVSCWDSSSLLRSGARRS